MISDIREDTYVPVALEVALERLPGGEAPMISEP